LCERCASANPSVREEREDAARLLNHGHVGSIPPNPADDAGVLPYERPDESPDDVPWFATGARALSCAACGHRIKNPSRSLDLSTRPCPSCGVACLLFTWVDTLVQIIPERTPAAFQEVLAVLRNSPVDEVALDVLTRFADLFRAIDEVG